jgi:hypothetical protein
LQSAPGLQAVAMRRSSPPTPSGRPQHEKDLRMQVFPKAADGIRTHDLLHGKRNVRSRASQERPAKHSFPSCRGSAMLSSFYCEIAGVSGLKPDSGPRRFGGRLRSPTVAQSRPRLPVRVATVPLLPLLHTRAAAGAGEWAACRRLLRVHSRCLGVTLGECSVSEGDTGVGVSVVTGTPREPEKRGRPPDGRRLPRPRPLLSRRGVEEVVEVRIRERIAGARTSRIGDFRISVPGSEVGS